MGRIVKKSKHLLHICKLNTKKCTDTSHHRIKTQNCKQKKIKNTIHVPKKITEMDNFEISSSIA
jgi:hypothetical protein